MTRDDEPDELFCFHMSSLGITDDDLRRWAEEYLEAKRVGMIAMPRLSGLAHAGFEWSRDDLRGGDD